jgi:hypothetical protein
MISPNFFILQPYFGFAIIANPDRARQRRSHAPPALLVPKLRVG